MRKQTVAILYIILICITIGGFVEETMGSKESLLMGTNLNKVLELGKEKWITLNQKKIGNTVWSTCYKQAVSRMNKECHHMDNEDRTRMAIHIYNCQLIQSGHTPHDCKETQTISTCLAHMRPEDNSYQTIVILTQTIENICFYIRSEKFQESLDETIANLGKEAYTTVNLLKALGEKHGDLANNIDETQQQQMKIFLQQETVMNTLHDIENEEKGRHEALVNQFGQVIDKSKKLGDVMDTISEDQQTLLHNQEDLMKQTITGMKNIANQQDQMQHDIHEHHEEIKENHANLKKNVDDLSETHATLNTQMDKSLNTQKEMATHQQSMLKFSKSLFKVSEDMKGRVEQALTNQKAFFSSLIASQEALDALKHGQREAFEKANVELETLLKTAETSSSRVLELQESFAKENAKLLGVLENLLDFASSNHDYTRQWQSAKFMAIAFLLVFCLSHIPSIQRVRWYLYGCICIELVVELYVIIPNTIFQPLTFMTRILCLGTMLGIIYQAWNRYINYERSTYELLASMIPHPSQKQHQTPRKSPSYASDRFSVFTPVKREMYASEDSDYMSIGHTPSKWKQKTLFDYDNFKRQPIDVAKGLF